MGIYLSIPMLSFLNLQVSYCFLNKTALNFTSKESTAANIENDISIFMNQICNIHSSKQHSNENEL